MKKTLQALTRDSINYDFGPILRQGLGFLLIPLYTRYLMTDDYGIVALAIITPISAIF